MDETKPITIQANPHPAVKPKAPPWLATVAAVLALILSLINSFLGKPDLKPVEQQSGSNAVAITQIGAAIAELYRNDVIIANELTNTTAKVNGLTNVVGRASE